MFTAHLVGPIFTACQFFPTMLKRFWYLCFQFWRVFIRNDFVSAECNHRRNSVSLVHSFSGRSAVQNISEHLGQTFHFLSFPFSIFFWGVVRIAVCDEITHSQNPKRCEPLLTGPHNSSIHESSILQFTCNPSILQSLYCPPYFKVRFVRSESHSQSTVRCEIPPIFFIQFINGSLLPYSIYRPHFSLSIYDLSISTVRILFANFHRLFLIHRFPPLLPFPPVSTVHRFGPHRGAGGRRPAEPLPLHARAPLPPLHPQPSAGALSGDRPRF